MKEIRVVQGSVDRRVYKEFFRIVRQQAEEKNDEVWVTPLIFGYDASDIRSKLIDTQFPDLRLYDVMMSHVNAASQQYRFSYQEQLEFDYSARS